jgi:hypothetical protein
MPLGPVVLPEADGSLRAGAPGETSTSLQLRRGAFAPVPGLGRAEDSEPLVVDAEGAAAPGLFGVQFQTAAGPGPAGTMAADVCSQPRASWWFTGAGATLDHTSSLQLTNVDPGPAVIDVQVLGPDGPVKTLGTQGITVAPGESTTLDLTDVAPGGEELAVHVRASRGRVVAAVSDSYREGAGQDTGRDWLPAQANPSRSLRLAGIPAGKGARTLLVANPGEREALVEVRVSGDSGAFAPTGTEQVRIAPGAVESVELEKALPGSALVRLRGNVRVVASLRSITGTDTSYAAVVGPLSDVAAAPATGKGPTSVVLSGGALGGGATVTAYSADGDRVDSKRLDLPPDTTLSWKPAAKADYVVVEPEARGSVFGAVTLTGPGASVVPLAELPVHVRLPAVAPALR